MTTATSFDLIERIFLTVFPLFVIVLTGYLCGRRRPSDIEFANRANMGSLTIIPIVLGFAL